MAQCKLTPREFISNTFSPQIGAVCSPAAEAVCQRNNLTFVQLLQPFSNLNAEGHIRDPQGTTIVVKNLHLSIQEIYGQPPEPSVARKLLNDSVSIEQCERTTHVKIGNSDVDIPISVPWFEAWREMFLNVQFPSDHEFTKHFIACMVVVSTADENPLEKIQQMAAQLSQTLPGKLPKWFNNNALRYYILLHDSDQQQNKTKAETVFTEMKNIYNANNCFFLAMNSRPPDSGEDSSHLPDPWSQFLTKQSDYLTTSDTNSSPRTPADTGGVSSMPNQVSSGSEKSSQAGTPIASQNPILLSPDSTDKIDLTLDLEDVPNTSFEVGQEAVSVTVHPLSPISQEQKKFILEENKNEQQLENTKSVTTTSTQNHGSPINANVWMDSPTKPTLHHGARLSTQDLERIRKLIIEFCLKSLLPYVERQIGILNDLISNKKGVSRSLFSATKRWFGTSKPGAPSSTPTNAVIYTVESPELQLRRLGDLCFMFGHFSLAYQAYHSAKRDFAADQAWLYYAGALEMAGLAAFMQGEMARKTIEYMDDAILTYSNTCKMPQFAVRATLLSSECLKGRGLHGEAAKQLIRMTSEDSDLRSALLLEQAAYCFIFPKMIHKYAFHAVLAGHRFSKAGQKKHSLRCYQQAYQIYQGKGWGLAEDHIHFTIGRQAASLKRTSEAVNAFEKLLNPFSKQPPAQQAAFLREFLQIQNIVTQESISKDFVGLPVLPLPIIDGNQIEVLCGPISENPYNLPFNSDEGGTMWSKLEESLLTEAQGSAPMIFKPTIAIFSNKSNNASGPIAIVDEPINFSIEFFNPLKIPLPLSKIKLIWEFKKDGETIFNETETENSLSESSSLVDVVIKDTISLQPNSRQRVILSCTPTQMGELKILGISYNLSNPMSETIEQGNPHNPLVVQGKKIFKVRGPKLTNVKEKPGAILYGVDKRLDIKVVDKYPFLDVSFSKMSPEMLCGEILKLDMTLKNTGSATLTNLFIGSANSELFCLEGDFIIKTNSKTTSVTKIAGGESLKVGEKLEMPFWIRAPHKKGDHQLDLLFYYENIEKNSSPKYRLCRHSWMLIVLDSVRIETIVRKSAAFSLGSPTLNLVLEVKNSNQVHDPFMNEITLTKVSLKSQNWRLKNRIGKPVIYQCQPQETCHLLFKMERRKDKDDKSRKFSDVCLVEDDIESILTTPYINFIEKNNLILKSEDNQNTGFQGVSAKINEIPNELVVETINLNMTLILRWSAKVMEGKTIIREAIGQHLVDLGISNKMYKLPEEIKPQQSEYPTKLMIFGPDRNVPDSNTVIKKEIVDEKEVRRNVTSFSLEHGKNVPHEFQKNRLCIVPVTLHLQNHSNSELDVKVNTIGTSSQTPLPNIKTQLYSSQASTSFRYIGQTTILCRLESCGSKSVDMKIVVANPGTYDLASRIDISAKTTDSEDFIAQDWRIESVCIVSDEKL